MPPEIEVWKRIVAGQTAYTRFYIATPDPKVVFCVTPRSAMLRSVIEQTAATRQRAADLRQWEEQARRIRVAAQAKQS